MVERLFIHAGAPKTATTFIQRGLFSNTALLADKGVYLPITGRLEYEPKAVSHHHLGWALIHPERYEGSTRGWEALGEELSRVDEPVAILSSEAFSRVARNPERAHLLADVARKLCGSVTIVYFVRNQLSLMNSLYGQRIKSLRMVENFAYHSVVYPTFNYETLLRPWYTSAKLDFIAVPFTGSRDVDPLRALLDAAGVDLEGAALVHDKDDVNASLGPVGIEAARLLGSYLRGIYPDFNADEDAAKKLYRASSSRAQKNGWCDVPFWGWTPATAARHVERVAASNNRFARAVWGKDWDIPMPLDTETSAVDWLDLNPPTTERIHRYVFSLAARFSQLRSQDLAA